MIVKGQKINDRYEIIRVIGEGGMANVYLAMDTILDRKVAVKVLRGDLATDEKFVRRFQREALSASSLNHPNIVEMYDVGEDEGNFYIVMEYVEGKNLKQLVKRRTKLSVPEVIDIMKQLTDGISHAHDSFIIHRDIKPQNMLILDSGLVKITDFGIAVALNSTQLTQTNSVMGSVHYLPPEQAAGKGVTFKSDIYALGIMMYELLTGNLPFKGENAVEIALKQLKEPIPSVRDTDSTIPQSVENIVLKACAKNPKNRYENVREMYHDLCNSLNEDNLNVDKVKYAFPELEESKPQKTEEKPKVEEEKTTDFIEEEKVNKTGWIIGIIISLIVVAGITALLLMPKFAKVPDVNVPNVINMTIEDAEAALESVGLEVNVTIKEVYSDTVEEGKIVRISPALKTLKKGTEITLYKSLGTEKIKIEDIIKPDADNNIYEIKGILLEKGLKVEVMPKDVDNALDYKDKEDIIIDYSPKDEEFIKGQTITLYYPNTVVYPDLTTYSLQEVEEFADKYELNLDVIEEETDLYEEGKIIYQSYDEGTLIARGASLTIKIAVKKPEVILPPVEEPGEVLPNEGEVLE